MSETNSTRAEILKVLCDRSVFPIGPIGYSWDIAEKVKLYLSNDSINKVKDVDNSIRQALETVDGYIYSNGTILNSKRKISFVKDQNGYNYYTFDN